MSSKTDIFDDISSSSDIFDEISPEKKSSPLSLKASATAYGSGFGGGASGIIPDAIRLLQPLSSVSQSASALNQLADLTGIKGTHEATKEFSGGKEPENALERVLQQAGQFGGQEALLGTGIGGIGGPAGALAGGGLGALHGSVSGAVYGGLKELGLDDTWALGLTMLASLSPIAAKKLGNKLLSKGKSGAPISETLSEIGSGESSPPPGAAPSLERTAPTGEITESLNKAASSAKKQIFGPNLSEEIPKSISPERVKNSTKGGMELEEAVSNSYNHINDLEKKAYAKSKMANKNINEIHAELAHDIQDFLPDLEKISDPSSPLKRFIESSKKLLKDLVQFGEDGSITGYKPVSNQTLIDQVQEYNQIPKFDFPTDTKTGIFKTLINKLTKSIDSTASKFPEANKTWQEAKAIHSQKSELFGDPDVSKWTKLAEKNFSKDFISTSGDIDKIRKLKPVLERSEEGRSILQKMKRDLVEKYLEDYFSTGKRFDKSQIARQIEELSPVLSEEEIKVVEQLFEEARTPGSKAASVASKFYKYLKRPSSIASEAGKIK